MKFLKKTLDQANEERDQLYVDLETTINHIDDLEQYSRKHNLEIHGIPEKTEENRAEQVITLGNALNVKISTRRYRHLPQIVYRQEPKQTQADYCQIQIISYKEGGIWSSQKPKESKYGPYLSRRRHCIHQRKLDKKATRTLCKCLEAQEGGAVAQYLDDRR